MSCTQERRLSILEPTAAVLNCACTQPRSPQTGLDAFTRIPPHNRAHAYAHMRSRVRAGTQPRLADAVVRWHGLLHACPPPTFEGSSADTSTCLRTEQWGCVHL